MFFAGYSLTSARPAFQMGLACVYFMRDFIVGVQQSGDGCVLWLRHSDTIGLSTSDQFLSRTRALRRRTQALAGQPWARGTWPIDSVPVGFTFRPLCLGHIPSRIPFSMQPWARMDYSNIRPRKWPYVGALFSNFLIIFHFGCWRWEKLLLVGYIFCQWWYL